MRRGEDIILKKDQENKDVRLEVLYYSKEDIPLEFKALPAEATIYA